MPKSFTKIDAVMKAYLRGRHTKGLAVGMPGGTFEHEERWVESVPLVIPGCTSTCSFRGRFDNVLQLDNGGCALVDLKTCHRRDEHLALYSRQLHAYPWCLEHPAPGAAYFGPIERMGVLIFEPNDFFKGVFFNGALLGPLYWLEINWDEQGFLKFLTEVVNLLDRPIPPDAPLNCPWCRYRLITNAKVGHGN